MWLIPCAITVLSLWSFTLKMNRLERLRFTVLGGQFSLCALSLLSFFQFLPSEQFMVFGCIVVFLGFCFSYHKNRNQQEHYIVRFVMLSLIIGGGLIFGLTIRPISILPLVFSCIIFHLHHEQVSSHLQKQNYEVRAMREHIQVLKGRVQRYGQTCEKHNETRLIS
ncbi:MAG: hypothetical protein AB8C84_01895 [Oligoflexales bacterium]